MILTLDIGNTRAKLTLFSAGEVVRHEAFAHAQTVDALRTWLTETPAITALHWCSVGPELPELETALRGLEIPVRRLLPTLPPADIRVEYHTPETLGADRLAAVLGARSLRPNENLLVVDAGTCITYDFLTADGRYLGGNISPGLEMRLDAMHHFTARLPRIATEGDVPAIGVSTETALRSGATLGIVHEIEGYCRQFQAEYGEVCVFLTGGNRFSFLISSEIRTFADDFLVARGLAALR